MIKDSTKEKIERVLRPIGMDGIAQTVYRTFVVGRHRNTKRFGVTLEGTEVRFSTEDAYSFNWFFPRYAGGRIHEKQVTETLLRDVREARCFADIGTNLGWYTCLASRSMPDGVVYGFEMDDLNFTLLKKNLTINGCENAKVFNVAVTDVPGRITYLREAETPSPGFRIAPHEGAVVTDHQRSVEAITLDGFFRELGVVPDVVKMDVEGAELQVLRGMMEIIRERRPTLFVEVHPWNLPDYDASVREVLALLFDAGYDVYEFEDMRSNDEGRPLKRLDERAELTANSMLYAVASK